MRRGSGQTHPHSLICQAEHRHRRCAWTRTTHGRRDRGPVRRRRAGAQRLGAAHPYTLAAKMVLASVLARQGRLNRGRGPGATGRRRTGTESSARSIRIRCAAARTCC